MGVCRNITDRKQAEQELTKSRAILQATIDCLPFDFFALGYDGRYILAKCHVQSTLGRYDWQDSLKKSVRTRKTLPFGWTTIGGLLAVKRLKVM